MTDHTQPGAESSAPDLDKLEALARAATPGPWSYEAGDNMISYDGHKLIAWQPRSNNVGMPQRCTNGAYIAAANPAAVLALIALARRATALHASIWNKERVTELAKTMAEEVAKNASTVPQLTFPHIYLGLCDALLGATHPAEPVGSALVAQAEQMLLADDELFDLDAVLFAVESNDTITAAAIRKLYPVGSARRVVERLRKLATPTGAPVAKVEPIYQARAKPVPGYPVSTAWDDISAEGLAHARAHPSSYEVRTVYAVPTGALVAKPREHAVTELLPSGRAVIAALRRAMDEAGLRAGSEIRAMMVGFFTNEWNKLLAAPASDDRSGLSEASNEQGDELVNRFLAWPLPASLTASLHPGIERPIGTHLMNADEAKAMVEYLLAAPTGALVAVRDEQHSDDLAVDRFAAAMKEKMAKSRAKGRGGWDSPEVCPLVMLQTMLADHVAKGDPVDVGNFAMMLFNRGGPTFNKRVALEETAESAAAPADLIPLAVRDVCELDYSGEDQIHANVLSVTVEDLLLILNRHFATQQPSPTGEKS